MQIIFSIFMGVIGACFGSFLCCQARRLRRKEKKQTSLGPHSVCLSCKTKLKWYDNIPIISWIALKGKCRKCHKKIGTLEFFSEVGMFLAFLGLSFTINCLTANVLDWLIFVTTLMLTLSLGFLAIYDGAYGELPTFMLVISIAFAITLLALKEWFWVLISGFSSNLVLNPLYSVLILGGLYLVLYVISKGKWVGDGDWLLGVAIGLALADPWLSLVTLFLSNFLACIIMFPSYKKDKKNKIYFGPFLVIAFVIVSTFATFFQSML